MEINESGLSFVFNIGTEAYKFDDDKFYRNEFNMLPGSKGIDIIASSDRAVHTIEIKNCKDNERDNIWRIGVNNKYINKLSDNDFNRDKESLDIEVSKKWL